jgi:flagellar biosynthesis protein FliQ
MNWLGYLALLFSALCLFLHRPWSLCFAIAAALCGLISTVMRHWDLVKQASDSFVAKVLIAAVAAAAIFFSPWIVNKVLSEVTLLRPSAFWQCFARPCGLADSFSPHGKHRLKTIARSQVAP